MQPSIPKVPKGAFFDLYGTLLILGDMKQAWADWMEVLYTALFPYDSSMTRAAFGHCCHQFFGKAQPLLTEPGLTVFEKRIHRLATSLDVAMEAPSLKRVASQATDAWQAHVRTDPEATELLATLSESKTLALISNFDHPPHAYRVLREAGLDRFFRTMVISGEVGVKKPDPGIFRIALEATNMRAEDVVYVGDTQEDVVGATAAGIVPILIVRPEDPGNSRVLDYTSRERQLSTPTSATGSPSPITISSLREVLAVIDEALA